VKPQGIQGALKILRFNWPWYAAALAGDALAWGLIRFGWLPGWAVPWAVLGLVVGNFWVLVSFVASHWIYDGSGVARGEWLEGVQPGTCAIGIFHAGQDEATHHVTTRFPDHSIVTFDFFEAESRTSASLLRARRSAGNPGGTPVQGHALPLRSGTLGLAVIAFAAHEIRDPEARVRFFTEIRRVMDAHGRAVVVEHLRDAWNALVYGPGAFHFLGRSAWEETFRRADLQVLEAGRQTPFVRTFILGKRP
jgi:hypothetical protein